ncbi:MAG: hypothetical protein V4713_07125 [Pseudomonadota bacterium]
MKYLPKKLVSLCLLLAAGNACFGVGREPEEHRAFRPDEWVAASDEKLDNLRGGFEVASGLMVSFGIVRTVSINGDLVSKTSFDLPDVSRITAEQAGMARAAIAEATLVQNGAGNFVDAGVRAKLEAGTLIQNTLNDQSIQTLTVINTGVNSLGMLKSLNTQGILKDALLGTMSNR